MLEQKIEKLTDAVEKLTEVLEGRSTLPLFPGKQQAGEVSKQIAETATTTTDKVHMETREDYEKKKRASILEELKNLGVKFDKKTSTENLEKLLEKTKADAGANKETEASLDDLESSPEESSPNDLDFGLGTTEEKKEEVKPLTHKDVVPVLQQFLAKFGNAETLKLLKQYGGKDLPSVPVEKLGGLQSCANKRLKDA